MENGEHSLRWGWTWWGHTPGPYSSSMIEIGNFNTIENFWRYWNNISPCTEYKRCTGYSLCLDHLTPLWEHEKNVDGFEFRIQNTEHWLNLVLGAIGGTLLPPSAPDNGITVIRCLRGRVEIWYNKEVSVKESLHILCKELEISTADVTYLDHQLQKPT